WGGLGTFAAPAWRRCVLLGSRRPPAAELPRHKVRTGNFQQRARAAAVVKEKMIPNLGQPGRAIRLDHRRGRTDQSVAVQVLVEAGFEGRQSIRRTCSN